MATVALVDDLMTICCSQIKGVGRMKATKPWQGLVPVGVWLSKRTGVPRQTLMSAALAGQLYSETLADGTTVCVRYDDFVAWVATYVPRKRRR